MSLKDRTRLNKSDISSLDFVINRFFMKVFKAKNVEIVRTPLTLKVRTREAQISDKSPYTRSYCLTQNDHIRHDSIFLGLGSVTSPVGTVGDPAFPNIFGTS